MMGSLSTVAIMAPSEQFLQWGGMMGIGCGAMLGISLAAIMMPQSRALYNLWLWGGLGFGGFMTLYQTQDIIMRAKLEQNYDPINHSMRIYMNSLNTFIRFLMIFGGQKK